MVGVLMLRRHERARFSVYVFLSCEILRAIRIHSWLLGLLAAGSILYLQFPAARQLDGVARCEPDLEQDATLHCDWWFSNEAVLIDIAGFKQVPSLPAAYEVTMADVRGALARQGLSETSIEQGDAVLFNYGWAVNWTNPSKYNDSFIGTGENQGSPGIGAEVANWLIERKVALVGGDSCCVEVRGPVPKESVHHLLFLGHGIPLLENLDLAELARDGATEFLFLGLPERIKGATGSPIRPVAVR